MDKPHKLTIYLVGVDVALLPFDVVVSEDGQLGESPVHRGRNKSCQGPVPAEVNADRHKIDPRAEPLEIFALWLFHCPVVRIVCELPVYNPVRHHPLTEDKAVVIDACVFFFKLGYILWVERGIIIN